MQSTLVHNCSVMGAVVIGIALNHTFRVMEQSILTSRAGFANLFWFFSKPILILAAEFAFSCQSLHVQDFFLKQCSNCTNICIVNVANRIISCLEGIYWCIYNKGSHATPRRKGGAHGVLIMEKWKYSAPVESHFFNATLFDAGRS